MMGSSLSNLPNVSYTTRCTVFGSLIFLSGGEYLGTIRGVSHTEIIGHKFTNTRPTDILDMMGGKAPFNPKQLMVQHARKLATEVESETGYGF